MSPQEFWRWFKANRKDLSGDSPDSGVINELDSKIASLADVTWEIGFHNNRHYLAISPIHSIADAQRVMDTAPVLRDWDIRMYKPPKVWDIKFRIEIDNRPFLVDGSRWQFICYRYDDNKCDIVFKPQIDLDATTTIAADAALTIVDGELGEEARRAYVLEIELVSQWRSEQSENAQNLSQGILADLIIPKSS